MSHFSSADQSCGHGNDDEGRGDEGSEDDECEEGKECDDGTGFAGRVPFAAAKSRWHEIREVPITATDLSMLWMMRRSSSSLLPG
jgi:hypothetical protein